MKISCKISGIATDKYATYKIFYLCISDLSPKISPLKVYNAFAKNKQALTSLSPTLVYVPKISYLRDVVKSKDNV